MAPHDSPTVCFLSGDLIFASRVQAAAEAAGWQFQLAGRPPATVQPAVAMVVVDLSTRSGVLGELMAACGEFVPQARVIAYGPHVQVARLRAAREAGVPTVLTRNQFDAGLSSLFASP